EQSARDSPRLPQTSTSDGIALSDTFPQNVQGPRAEYLPHSSLPGFRLGGPPKRECRSVEPRPRRARRLPPKNWGIAKPVFARTVRVFRGYSWPPSHSKVTRPGIRLLLLPHPSTCLPQ